MAVAIATPNPLDADGDGKISFEEFMVFHEKQLEPVFARRDADGDGEVSELEFEDSRARHRRARE